MVRIFIHELLEFVFRSDPDTERRISRLLVDPRIEAQRRDLKKKLEEFLPECNKTGYFMPLEHELKGLSAFRIEKRLMTQFDRERTPETSAQAAEVLAKDPEITQGYLDHFRGTGINRQSSVQLTTWWHSTR